MAWQERAPAASFGASGGGTATTTADTSRRSLHRMRFVAAGTLLGFGCVCLSVRSLSCGYLRGISAVAGCENSRPPWLGAGALEAPKGYEVRLGESLRDYAAADASRYTLEEARARCDVLVSTCSGYVCSQGGGPRWSTKSRVMCTVRSGWTPYASDTDTLFLKVAPTVLEALRSFPNLGRVPQGAQAWNEERVAGQKRWQPPGGQSEVGSTARAVQEFQDKPEQQESTNIIASAGGSAQRGGLSAVTEDNDDFDASLPLAPAEGWQLRDSCWQRKAKCKSSAKWHELHPEGLLGLRRPALVLDLEAVLIHEKVIARGLSYAQQRRLDSAHLELAPYVYWQADKSEFDSPRFSLGFRTEAGALDLSHECDSTVEGTAILLPPHHPDNVHHLHKDLLFKVAYLLTHFRLQPASTRLYLLRGDERRFFKHTVMMHALDAILRDVVYPFERILEKRERVCHRRFLYTPSWSWPTRLWSGYDTTVGRWGYQNWRGVASNWARWLADGLGLADLYSLEGAKRRCREILAGTPPSVLWTSRQTAANPRRIVNLQELLSELRQSFAVSTIGDADDFADNAWPAARPTLISIIRRVVDADVLGGYFGAGMVNMLYVRPGAVILVLQGPGWFFSQQIFKNLAALRRVSFYVSDVHMYQESQEEQWCVRLPVEYGKLLRADLLDRVKRECGEGVTDIWPLLDEPEDTKTAAPPSWALWEYGRDFEEPRCAPGETLQWDGGALGNASLSPFELARCYLVRNKACRWGQEDFHTWDRGAAKVAAYVELETQRRWAAKVEKPPSSQAELCRWAAARGSDSREPASFTGAVLVQGLAAAPGSVSNASTGWRELAVAMALWYFGRSLALELRLSHHVLAEGGVPVLVRAFPPLCMSGFSQPEGARKTVLALCACTSQGRASVPLLDCPVQPNSPFAAALFAYPDLEAAFNYRTHLLSGLERALDLRGPSFRIEEAGPPPRGLAALFHCPREYDAGAILSASAYADAGLGTKLDSLDIVVAPFESGSPTLAELERCQQLVTGVVEVLTELGGKRVKVRVGLSATRAAAVLALARTTLCPAEDPVKALCFWAALGGERAFLPSSPWLFEATRPSLPRHMHWLDATSVRLLPSAEAARMRAQEIVQWVRTH